jgi:hypothetical protein
MRKNLMALAGALAFSTLGVSSAAAQQAGKETAKDATITAEVIDLSCKLVHGLSGPDHTMCAQVCADKGIPLALFSNGEVYLPVSMGMPGDGSNAQLKPFAEQKVQVKGKIIERGGVKAIVIEEIRKS